MTAAFTNTTTEQLKADKRQRKTVNYHLNQKRRSITEETSFENIFFGIKLFKRLITFKLIKRNCKNISTTKKQQLNENEITLNRRNSPHKQQQQ